MDLSVVICTYNRADSLRDTLDSLSAQNVPAALTHEVVVVDNPIASLVFIRISAVSLFKVNILGRARFFVSVFVLKNCRIKLKP